jgi:Saxitoxin biosynthesis operon protein SxtJ
MISEEIKNIKETKKDLRKFGITVGLALLVIAGILFWREKESFLYFGIVGLVLLLTGLVFPVILKPLNKAWMTLAILMGWVMTRVILTILYYLVLTPLRFLAMLFRKNFLDLTIDKSAKSYWEVRTKTQIKPADYERQF